MDIRLPGRATTVDQLRPGCCFLAPRGTAVALCLLISHRHQPGALVLNRAEGGGGALPIAADLAGDADVLALTGAVLVPSRALADLALGGAVEAGCPAVYLGDGCAYLRGRTPDGQVLAIDVVGGFSSAVDLAFLPRATRWRVAAPSADGGHETVFESGAP